MVVPWIILRHMTPWMFKVQCSCWNVLAGQVASSTLSVLFGHGRFGGWFGKVMWIRFRWWLPALRKVALSGLLLWRYGWPRVRVLSGLRSVKTFSVVPTWMIGLLSPLLLVTFLALSRRGRTGVWGLVCVSRRPRLSSRLWGLFVWGNFVLRLSRLGGRWLLGRISLFWVLPLRLAPVVCLPRSLRGMTRLAGRFCCLVVCGSPGLCSSWRRGSLGSLKWIMVGSAGFLRITRRLNFGRVSERPRVFRGRLIVTCALLSTGVWITCRVCQGCPCCVWLLILSLGVCSGSMVLRAGLPCGRCSVGLGFTAFRWLNLGFGRRVRWLLRFRFMNLFKLLPINLGKVGGGFSGLFFCKSNRHEVFEFDEVLPKHLHSCNFDMVRKESLLCPAVSGVGVGAMLSPAAVNDHIDQDRPDIVSLFTIGVFGDVGA